MKAIRTKYHGATNSRPARLTATTHERGQTVSLSLTNIDTDKAHAIAARTLCDKYDWKGELIGGGFPDGTMVWVFADSHDRA